MCGDADDALSKSQRTNAELEMEMNKVRVEASGLRDELLQMQDVNEGLAQDRTDLNNMILQVAQQYTQDVISEP